MTAAELLAQIARRDASRSEATLQADIRQLILSAPLALSVENLVTADTQRCRSIDYPVAAVPHRTAGVTPVLCTLSGQVI